MRIDVFSDVVCPWCFIGKRRLDAALSEAGIADADIRWHAFQLNPTLPPEGVDRRRYLEEKFGGPVDVERLHRRVSEAGLSAGIEFRFDRIERSPNSFDAHRLLKLVEPQGRQHALNEALFKAYFLDGRDLGDRKTLAAIAGDAGVEGEVAEWLDGGAGAPEVREDLATAAELEISGVPFFIFAGRYALPGAQPPEVFTQALAAARDAKTAQPARPIG
jgi:predicted DsbA family dithiol-disulfide isomerase